MEQLHPLALWLIALQLIKYWQIAPIKHWPIKVYTPPTFITFHVPINATSCCFPACQVNDDKHPNPSLLSLAHLYPGVFQFSEVWQFRWSNAAVMLLYVLQPDLSVSKKGSGKGEIEVEAGKWHYEARAETKLLLCCQLRCHSNKLQ